jgi:Rod binding domain-containing protein
MSDLNVLSLRWSKAIQLDSGKAKVQTVTESGKTEGINNEQARLKEACHALESLFISHLLKEMRATVTKSGFLSGGRAEELYTSMLDGQLAKELSAKGGIGLATLVLDNLEGKPAKPGY